MTRAATNSLRKNGLLTGLNPEIRQALIEMPPTLSGISQAKHDQFMNEAAAALNGPALAEIQELGTRHRNR